MCSFLAYNNTIENIEKINLILKRRGPDETSVIELNGWTFLHNLLSLTGTFTRQPFIDTTAQIVCFFNGEIYNWKDIEPQAASDGEVLIPQYREHGSAFLRGLDGEFALALFDFTKGVLVLSADVFATKPLWYAKNGSHMGLSSYESPLRELGFSSAVKVPANTTLVLSLEDFSIQEERTVFDFDPSHQTKDSLVDFFNAFAGAIRKRAYQTREKVFIGLSSGYDSGAIASELLTQKIPFTAYSILGRENRAVLNARQKLLPKGAGVTLNPGYAEYRDEKAELSKTCEPFIGSLHERRFAPRSILDDGGAVGLGIICKRARADGHKIYLSGQGSDEILSDYRMHGHGLTGHSTIDGKFPDDLALQFPWHNFYNGAQKLYIAKEEHVAGAYGIEARYPFLDASVVQEFLYLTPAIKNTAYKAPLKALFDMRFYPYAEDQKIGFVPRKKTVGDYIHRFVDAFVPAQR